MWRYVCVILGLAVLVAGCDGDILHSHDIDDDRDDLCLAILHDRTSFGPVRETWECYDRFDRVRAPPLVILTRLGGLSEGYGQVFVGGEAQPAAFQVQGINRRWDFGCDAERMAHPFAFIIEPDGSGLYYNFLPSSDGVATARDFYDCELAP
ncbi:MAG: hypothetical protein OXC69_05430 [Candidatus Tectomicrobia bacterium]|nr:hypothetical protein [Candidatus Tectomicrobia bacterium]